MCALFGPLTNSSSSARRFVLARAKMSSVSTYDSLAFFRAIWRNLTKSSQLSAKNKSHHIINYTLANSSDQSEQRYAAKQRLTVLAGCVDHLHVRWRVNSFNVWVNGLLDKVSVQLSSSQLAPHCRLIAAFSKLIGTIQVPYVLYQDLEKWRKERHKGTNIENHVLKVLTLLINLIAALSRSIIILLNSN